MNIDKTKEESEAVSVTPKLSNMDGSMIVNSESTIYVPKSDSTLVTHALEMTQTQQSSQMDPSQVNLMQQIVNESHFAGSQSILDPHIIQAALRMNMNFAPQRMLK